ncbi:phage minor capsid protein [Micromonospora sp. NPDC003816]|uniref:phage minor capsid protein n=1 Tax=Micromonospora sp. NPDC003816 TaxID=3364224 RepID=UPI0036B17C35
MALTGDQIEEISRGAVDLYRNAESAILDEVTRRLAAGQDAPDWAVTRLGALASLRTAVERILGLVAGESAGRLRELLADAYRTGQGIATRDLPAQLLPRDPDAAAAARAAGTVPRIAVVENLAAALVTDIEAKHSSVLRRVLDVYRTVIAQATGVSVAGGMTRRQASQWAYARLVDQGVVSFTDAGGRRWRLSSYVEMATRTVTQRVAVQGQTDRLTTLGVDTVIVSDSPRECPRCRPWEGKILSISGGVRGRVALPSMVGDGTVTVDIAGSVDEARAAGLQHPNCTHSLRSYLPGATRRPTQPTPNPAGYAAKERQREIERGIRRWKERQTAALTPEAAAAAGAKVRQWQGAMRDHLAANPELKRLPYREQIGAGNQPRPGPTRAATPPATPAPRPSLADRVATGEKSRDPLGGGVMADTYRVRLNDGTSAVYKRAKDSSGRPAVEQQDAEELGALVARAVGVRAPEIHRASRTEVYMSYLDGQVFAELDDAAAGALQRSDEGARLGLADLLMGNTDRNSGNLLVDRGRIAAIDHGGAFEWHPEYNRPSGTPQFRDDWWSAYGSSDTEQWHANPLSADDIALLRQRLDDLRAEFDRLGRADWWAAMMERLRALEAHATGQGLLS